MADGVKRKLSAILSADVVGYSKLMEADEETTVRTMESYRSIISSIVRQHNGRVVDSPGDNILSEFPSVVDSVQCAVEIQHVIEAKNAVAPESRRMHFRIGIHLGDVIEEKDRIYGHGVNIAARIEGLANPGGICISGMAYDQIASTLALGYENIGEHHVKNIDRPIQVYRIPLEPEGMTGNLDGRSKSLAGKPRVAVLPFENMSSDSEQEHLCDGIVNDIIARLSANSYLAVISRNSTFAYKGERAKATEVYEELNAGYVVEGSIRKAGARVRVTAQLIDATSDEYLWSETYNREMTDIFELQDEIAESIATSLNAEYIEAEMKRAKRTPTKDLTAYESVLRARVYWEEFSREGNERAKELGQTAIDIDPDYADAYAVVGWTYWGDYFFQYTRDPDPLEKAKDLADKAIAIDDSCQSAFLLLHNIYSSRGQRDRAIIAVERAVELNPSDAGALHVKGHDLVAVGNYEEGIKTLEKALQLNPRPAVYYRTNLARAYRLAGNYGHAERNLELALLIDPTNLETYIELTILNSDMDRIDRAQTNAAKVIELSDGFSVQAWGERIPAYYDNPGQAQRDIAALRKAGLK